MHVVSPAEAVVPCASDIIYQQTEREKKKQTKTCDISGFVFGFFSPGFCDLILCEV